MAARKRWRGTTTERGYGHTHRLERTRRLTQFRQGDPCAHCGQPIYGPPASIDLGHTTDRTSYIGLTHRACNRADGAIRGNRRRGQLSAAQQPWRASRIW